MKFGSAWYPEHWPKSRWPKDIELMKKAGMNVVRIAEFAWSTMEPEEERYEFGWLDDVLGLLDKAGIDAVIGTPTAAPPAWLTSGYPEVLVVEADGRRARHGARCHFNPCSRTYLGFCQRIVEQMASRYGKHARVTGWQIDNEYSRISYDEETRAAFQNFLKETYETLRALNEAWTTAYWSQTYSDFSQIPIPGGGDNPGLRLQWQRFATRAYVNYQAGQVEVIRRHDPKARQFITSNFMSWFDGFDHYQVAQGLDLASNDLYCPTGRPDPAHEAGIHSLLRGYKRKNWWMMETQPSGVNWAGQNTMLEPGLCRLRNWQAVAHGADGLLYWQWRNALGGQEQLHGSVVGQDGEPRPAYGEICRIGAEFSKAAPLLESTSPEAEVAILNSYEARWAVGFQRHNKEYDFVGNLESFQRPLYKRSLGVDILSATADLKGYGLVVVPGLWILEQETARNVAAFVKAGGVAIIGARTGSRDQDNKMFPALPPGPLSGLVGVEVEDVFPQLAHVTVKAAAGSGLSGKAGVWLERLRLKGKGAQILASFGKECGWLEDMPAITLRREGKGTVLYLAGCPDSGLMDKVVGLALKLAGITPRYPAKEGVEYASRFSGDGREVLVLMNHSDKSAKVKAPRGREVLTGRACAGMWNIEARGVAVFDVRGKA
jgi:beta-galactosidase